MLFAYNNSKWLHCCQINAQNKFGQKFPCRKCNHVNYFFATSTLGNRKKIQIVPTTWHGGRMAQWQNTCLVTERFEWTRWSPGYEGEHRWSPLYKGEHTVVAMLWRWAHSGRHAEKVSTGWSPGYEGEHTVVAVLRRWAPHFVPNSQVCSGLLK